jgi:uncharacterized protein DUF4143
VSGDLIPRLAEQRLDQLMRGFRVVVVNGPRQAGKTTLCSFLLRAVSPEPFKIYYYRDRLGHEVDFVLERYDGSVVAIEVRAAARFSRYQCSGSTHRSRFSSGSFSHVHTPVRNLDIAEFRLGPAPVTLAVPRSYMNRPVPAPYAPSPDFGGKLMLDGRKGVIFDSFSSAWQVSSV